MCSIEDKIHVKRAAHAARRLTLGFVHQPLPEGTFRLSEVAPYGATIPKWHARYLGLASMTKQGLMPRKFPAQDSLRDDERPIAGGSPPALERPSIAERHRVSTMASSALSRKTYDTSEFLANSLFANLLQVVFLEVNPFAKETLFGATRFACLVSNCCQLNAAYVIGDLKQIIRCGRGVAINDGLLRNRFFNRTVNCTLNHSLPIVVIDFDDIERLKEFEAVAYRSANVAMHFACQIIGAPNLSFLVCECQISEIGLFGKDAECRESFFAYLEIHRVERCMPSGDGREMERFRVEPGVPHALLILANACCDVVFLIMKNQGDQIVFRAGADVSRFVNKDGKLPHLNSSCRKIKNAGGNPRLLRQAFLLESRLRILRTGKGKSAHFIPQARVFFQDVIITNTCSIHNL